jgi:hypothetical protein
MQRELTWHGGRNIRDLGGLPTITGTTTTPNRVARSARRELLTDVGWRDAAAWGLHSIVDLRTEAETGSRDEDPIARPPEHVTITLAPTEDQQNPEFVETCFPILDSPEYWAHNVRILPDLVRTTLEAIADGEPGILFHCSAGRDRTGLISTLLLANAGVTVDAIVADYALGVRAMAGAGANGAATHDRQATWTREETDAFLADVTPHVITFASRIDEHLNTLAVTAQTRARLRELLTA